MKINRIEFMSTSGFCDPHTKMCVDQKLFLKIGRQTGLRRTPPTRKIDHLRKWLKRYLYWVWTEAAGELIEVSSGERVIRLLN